MRQYCILIRPARDTFCCAADVVHVVSTGQEVTFWLQMDKNCQSGSGFQIQYSAIRSNQLLACDLVAEFACDKTMCVEAVALMICCCRLVSGSGGADDMLLPTR